MSNNCTQSAEGHVLLSTALINVKSKHGEQITCRALIDNASQNSLISNQCADRLKLPLKHTNHKLVGVNETFAETSLYSTNFEFSSCVSSDKFQVKALLVSKVTSAMPNFPIKYHEWPHIKDLTLADLMFYIENEIDILLGADVFMTLISGTPIMGPKGTPSALPTKLGHFLFFPIAFSADIAKMYRQILISQDDACFQQIFWRKSPEEPLVIFKLNTVTYGTSCAPFLAIRTLKQLCEDENIAFHRQLSSQKIISMLMIC
ncbi:DUF1758 domain-containing protein [Trichonephila clavipes]|nr:DUF1758 domain-containing protein [Trichonephila clavipes]